MMRLYLDEGVLLELARQLRLRGYDVLTTQEAGMSGKSDPEQLAFATAERRAILTFDNDYHELARQWFHQGRSHSGILVSQEYHPNEMRTLVNLCLSLLDRETEESMANAIYPLEQYK